MRALVSNLLRRGIGSAILVAVCGALIASAFAQSAHAASTDPCATNAGARLVQAHVKSGGFYGVATLSPACGHRSTSRSASVSPDIADYCGIVIYGSKTSGSSASAQGYVNCNQSVNWIEQFVGGQHCTSWNIFQGCTQWTDAWQAPNQPCTANQFGVYQAYCPLNAGYYSWNGIPRGWLIRLTNYACVSFYDGLIACNTDVFRIAAILSRYRV
jgi:hypothetical protein